MSSTTKEPVILRGQATLEQLPQILLASALQQAVDRVLSGDDVYDPNAERDLVEFALGDTFEKSQELAEEIVAEVRGLLRAVLRSIELIDVELEGFETIGAREGRIINVGKPDPQLPLDLEGYTRA